MRIPMLPLHALRSDARALAERWGAEGGDPNVVRTLGRLPDRLLDYVRFYSRLARTGVLEHRVKELVRLRLAQLNACTY